MVTTGVQSSAVFRSMKQTERLRQYVELMKAAFVHLPLYTGIVYCIFKPGSKYKMCCRMKKDKVINL